MWRQRLGERQRCPALSFYSPKMEEWEVWPEDSRSDGEKEWRGQKKEKEKNTGNGLGMIAKEAGMWTKKKCKKNNEGRKKRKIKGGALMSWFWPWEMWDHPHGLNALQERGALFIQALKQFPHAGSMKMKMNRGKPGLQYKLERAFTNVHTSAINPSNKTVKNIKCTVWKMLHPTAAYPAITATQTAAINKKKKCFAQKERVDLLWSYGNKG